MKTLHELKTWDKYFDAILHNKKRFEYRLNDRNFKVGDELNLKEFLPNLQKYTGREIDYLRSKGYYTGDYLGLNPIQEGWARLIGKEAENA